MQPFIQHTPTTLIIGFLGAGKTTLLNRLLAHKAQARWAIVVNEFGKIGIDAQLIDADSDVRQVNGGCICCSSVLPLQIALAKLLSTRPDRLLIEPTGLAHPDELIDTLLGGHYQQSLRLGSVICVLSGAQWRQEKYRTHAGYLAHIKAADVIVYHSIQMHEIKTLHDWLHQQNPRAHILGFDTLDAHIDTLLNTPRTADGRSRPTYSPLSPMPADTQANNPLQPPYRYHDTTDGYTVGGWLLPSDWVFAADALTDWLLTLPALRIKGVLHTDNGWIRVNISDGGMSFGDTTEQAHTKLELIFNADAHDWENWDAQLMTLRIDENPPKST